MSRKARVSLVKFVTFCFLSFYHLFQEQDEEPGAVDSFSGDHWPGRPSALAQEERKD